MATPSSRRSGSWPSCPIAGEYAMADRNPQGERWTPGIADPHVQGRLIARLFADGRWSATPGLALAAG